MERDNGYRPEVYLPPEEQLIIGAKIARLFEADVETFDPSTQVQDAIEIISALDGRIKTRAHIGGTMERQFSKNSNVRAGATNAGNVNASFNEEKTLVIKLGVDEYKIGYYVATKAVWKTKPKMVELGTMRGHKVVQFVNGTHSALMFEHFRDRGEVNEVFEKDPAFLRIDYETPSYELAQIGIWTPKPQRIQLGGFVFSLTKDYDNLELWSKNKPRE